MVASTTAGSSEKGTAMRIRSRGVLSAAGRTSIRIWLRAAGADELSVRNDAIVQYGHLAERVEWPEVPALRLHLALSVLPGAARVPRAAGAGSQRGRGCGIGHRRPDGDGATPGAGHRCPEPQHPGACPVHEGCRRRAARIPGTGMAGDVGRARSWPRRIRHVAVLRPRHAPPVGRRAHRAGVLRGRRRAVQPARSRLRFRRSVTLATGGERCDFCFERTDLLPGGRTALLSGPSGS